MRGKIRVLNDNYTPLRGIPHRLRPITLIWVSDPWYVAAGELSAHFPTHAEAITYADKLVREPK